MSNDFEYDVFLSHSSQDKPVLRDLVARLQSDGVRVWFDEKQIDPGDRISAEIERGLQVSRCVVLAISKNAIECD